MKKIILFISALLMSSVGIQAQSSSDTCAATAGSPITTAGSFSISAIDGTDIPDPVCADAGAGATNGEWYRYTPSVSEYVTISSDLPANNGKDTRFHVYSGSCGSLVCIGGDDDSGAGFLSEGGFDAVSGQTYYIAWDDRWDDSGFDWELIEGTPPPPPPPITFTSQSVSASGSDRAVVDMNNDGLDDLVSVTATNININYQKLSGGFDSVNIGTSEADNTPSWSLAAGDVDNNGYNDLLYAGGSGVTFMIANSDGTAFTEDSEPGYVFSQRSNFVDINNDGFLEAFVCHDVAPSVFYEYDGISAMDYIGNNIAAYHANGGNYGSVWVDYDNDKDMDLFLAKCRGGNVSHKWNELWENDGSGNFTNVADGFGYYGVPHNNSSNLGDPVQTWSSAWADFDNDGDMDVYVGASSAADGIHKVMRNNGDKTFTDITASAGVDIPSAPFGIENAPADFDNDGYVDILTNGSILFNNGDFTFSLHENGMPPSGPIGDVNNDGFLDVFNGNLRLNDGNSNNWLKVCLTGDGGIGNSNRNGIGARVQITSPGLGTQIRDIRSGEGFRYMSSLNAHFGLGADASVGTLTVFWPSGTVDVIVNPAINSQICINEGETLSLEQSMVNDLILYPNPTKDVLYLNATYGFENAIFSVFDMNGRRVMNSRFSSQMIDVSQLSAGNYILRILDDGLMKSQKFIKR